MPICELRSVHKTFTRGSEQVNALKGVSLTVDSGEFVVVTGPSGSGKSTLLHVAAGLDSPDSGEVLIDGRDLAGLTDDDRTAVRRERLGFVFQFFHLLPTLSAVENVMLPLLLDDVSTDEARSRAIAALDKLGLKARANHRPRELSGGEQQRTAVARALVNDPALVLADEPTGNLDSESGLAVMRLLSQVPELSGAAVIMVTHDPRFAAHGNRHLDLVDGKLSELK